MSGGAKATIVAAVLAFGCLPAASETSILTKAEEARVWEQGELSGKAEACGLDWRSLSFNPMMTYWRRHGKSERQMAFIGMYHGTAMGFTSDKSKPCTDAMRRKIRAQLPFKG